MCSRSPEKWCQDDFCGGASGGCGPQKNHPDTLCGEIAAKVRAGERLTLEDGVRLFQSSDIHQLGELANLVRERLHGRRVYYNVNRHINYTNYCVLRCRFCSFARPYAPAQGARNLVAAGASDGARPAKGLLTPFSRGGYELTVDEVVTQAREAADHGATEVHIVGGLHPRLPFAYYEEMCRSIREACPGLHIKAFTAIEIIHFTRISRPRLSIREVLERLRAAGLGSLPGGGAEIFDDRVHEEAFKSKVGEAGWFDVHRTAHELGIFSNATMLYGHVESPEERVRHLLKLREHQDASLAGRPAHFNCLIPLSFIPDGSDLAHLPGPTGLDDLKTLAISRLVLDNVPHIKAFWIMQSPKLAQVSLDWGVDDLDGTVVHYDITRRENAAGGTHQELTVDRIRRMIREAGRIPVERDTLYREVIRDPAESTASSTRG
ncbi:MAG: CofH family radical SAM protein [Phycisphaerae bacterium]|nr:CofH family radical SAM protein [Phycisphaerae bacterium]